MVLFRDWIWQEKKLVTVLVAGLQRLDGKATQDAVENVVAFKVETVSWLIGPLILQILTQ